MGTVLARRFLEIWEGNGTMTALLRALSTNGEAAKRGRQVFGRQLRPVVAAVCPDPDEAAVRAGLVASQVLGMALCRYVLRLPPVVTMSRTEVVRWLGPTLQRYLVAD